MIYFDNAATSGKKPQTVVNAVNFALNNLSANPGRSGHDLALKAADTVYKAREKISEFFGADGPENVIFTLNCTHSINCVLKGLINTGDHVVISNLEHNAVMRPLNKMGVNFSIAKISDDIEETLNEFKTKIKVNTKLVLVTGASNVTGKILPIAEIGKMCEKRGIFFCVDSAQIAGVLPINMQKMNIDFLCLAPHKGLYAPMGLGVLICRKPINNTIIEGGTGTSSIDSFQPQIMPEKLESGTVNLPAIAGLSAGVDFVKQKGIDKIYNHELKLTKMLYNGLKNNPNIMLYTPEPVYNTYAPVLPFNYKGLESTKTAQLLNSYGIAVRSGLHCAPTAHKAIGTLPHGAVRVSFGVFNTEAEVERLISILKSKKIIEKNKNSY